MGEWACNDVVDPCPCPSCQQHGLLHIKMISSLKGTRVCASVLLLQLWNDSVTQKHRRPAFSEFRGGATQLLQRSQGRGRVRHELHEVTDFLYVMQALIAPLSERYHERSGCNITGDNAARPSEALPTQCLASVSVPRKCLLYLQRDSSLEMKKGGHGGPARKRLRCPQEVY